MAGSLASIALFSGANTRTRFADSFEVSLTRNSVPDNAGGSDVLLNRNTSASQHFPSAQSGFPFRIKQALLHLLHRNHALYCQR
ncbi:MAG: hypothetical protein OXP11_11195, partial [Gammaproteobacteria bacterium]|nr:hypothetical protein [Gammaproteobacteria bacterium]